MSNSNETVLRYIEETTWGTTPATPAMKELRFTSETLDDVTDSSISPEIRSDRQVPDVVRTDKSASGDINFAWSYGSYDDLIAGFLSNTWPTAKNITADTIAATATGITTATTTNLVTGMNVGDWVKVAGFTTAANNGFFRIKSVVDGDHSAVSPTYDVITFDTSAPTFKGVLTEEAAGDDITVKGSTISNGVAKKSFTIEKEFDDVNDFDNFVGMRVGAFNLDISTGDFITGSFSFTGKKGADTATSTLATTSADPTTTDVMNVIDNVGFLYEGGTAITDDILNVSFSASTALRPLPAVGKLGATEIGVGVYQITGTLQVYMDNRTLLNKYRSFSETSLVFKTEDAAGNAYIFDFPAIKFTQAQVLAGGQDQDVIVDMTWTAKAAATSSKKMMTISRFPA